MLEKLKTAPSKKKLTLITLVALGVFITLTIVFRFYEAALQAGGYGIVDFEFAFDQATAQTILTAWDGLGLLPVALEAVYIDYIYIGAYGIGLFCVVLFLIRALEDRWYNIGVIMAISPLAAGVFDIVENINLSIMLNDPIGFPSSAPFIATIFAGIKFTFLLVTLGFILVVAIILLIRKLRKNNT